MVKEQIKQDFATRIVPRPANAQKVVLMSRNEKNQPSDYIFLQSPWFDSYLSISVITNFRSQAIPQRNTNCFFKKRSKHAHCLPSLLQTQSQSQHHLTQEGPERSSSHRLLSRDAECCVCADGNQRAEKHEKDHRTARKVEKNNSG